MLIPPAQDSQSFGSVALTCEDEGSPGDHQKDAGRPVLGPPGNTPGIGFSWGHTAGLSAPRGLGHAMVAVTPVRMVAASLSHLPAATDHISCRAPDCASLRAGWVFNFF